MFVSRYSAKFIDIENKGDYESILIGAGTIFNQILLWSASKGNILATLNGHQGVIFSIDYSHMDNLLFSTSDDRSVNVWKLHLGEHESSKVSTAELLTRFYGHDARVWKCCSFIDAKTKIQYLCSIGEDLNCCLWNVSEKTIVYRFNAMRKGSKNIWSLCINPNNDELITGWADGGLRRFSLRSYLKKEVLEENVSGCEEEFFEWPLKTENQNDFYRNILFLGEKIVCCTNLGCLYLIDSNSNQLNSSLNGQNLLIKSELLAKFNVMSKVNLVNDFQLNNCILAIGTLKGFIFLVSLNSEDKQTSTSSVSCIDVLTVEREITPLLNTSGNSSKICSVIWTSFKDNKKYRYFLLGIYFSNYLSFIPIKSANFSPYFEQKKYPYF